MWHIGDWLVRRIPSCYNQSELQQLFCKAAREFAYAQHSILAAERKFNGVGLENRFVRKSKEIFSELRSVLDGRTSLLDALAPPVIFLLVSAITEFNVAMWVALVLAGGIAIIRLLRRQPLFYALGGLFSVLLAFVIARWLGRSEGFFLPGIVNGSLMVILCLASVLLGKPLVAWSSFLVRRWPLHWYWHPQVRPAYTEVTLIWGAFFAIRLTIQLFLFKEQQAIELAWVNVISGWPAIILLLVASYLYGGRRLQKLHGPSVDEYLNNTPPPWQGQQRGF